MPPQHPRRVILFVQYLERISDTFQNETGCINGGREIILHKSSLEGMEKDAAKTLGWRDGRSDLKTLWEHLMRRRSNDTGEVESQTSPFTNFVEKKMQGCNWISSLRERWSVTERIEREILNGVFDETKRTKFGTSVRTIARVKVIAGLFEVRKGLDIWALSIISSRRWIRRRTDGS